MVRVAGRSGSCHTCIQRHVKCDQGKPVCERCVKAGYLCRGYARELQIVDEGRRLEQRRARSAATALAAEPWQESNSAEETLRGPGVQYASVPTALDCSAFQAEMYLCYFDTHMFIRGGFLKFWNWIHGDDATSLTFQQSLQALRAIYFGRKFNCQQSMTLGIASYAQGLNSLNRDLQNKRQALELSTLASITALQTVEIVGQTSLPAWLHHGRGLSRIVELRGPKAHQSVGGRLFLQMNRVSIILQALYDREHCFLEQQDWKTIPWLGSPKSITYQLHDIFCDIPGLAADANQLKTLALTPQQKKDLYLQLSSKIFTLFHACFEWRAKWERENPDCCSEVAATGQTEEAAGRIEAPFATRLQFSDIIPVYGIALYNAILTILFRYASFLLGNNFDVLLIARQVPYSKTNPFLKAPAEVLDMQVAAIEILRCVQDHLQDPSGTTGAYLIAFPLGCAYEAYTPDTPEAIWMTFMMQEIASISGLELTRGRDWVERKKNLIR